MRADTTTRSGSGWVRLLVRTRRCRACATRHARRLPYCPVCKTRPGHDGIERDQDGPPWAGPVGFSGFGH